MRGAHSHRVAQGPEAREGAAFEPAIFDVEDIGRDIYCLARTVRPVRLYFALQFLLRAHPSRERVLRSRVEAWS